MQISPGLASSFHAERQPSYKNRSRPRVQEAQAGARALSSRRGRGERGALNRPGPRLCSGDQGGVAQGLQGSDGLGHERGLLLDDGVIDGGAETLVEDLDPEQFGRSSGAVLVGAGNGDIKGQDLVGKPGESELSNIFLLGPPAFLFEQSAQ